MLISVLFFPVGKPMEVRQIDNESLEAMQALVGGLIERVKLIPGRSIVLICNEEGIMRALPPNRYITPRGRTIVGDFFVVKERSTPQGVEFVSLKTQDDVLAVKERVIG